MLEAWAGSSSTRSSGIGTAARAPAPRRPSASASAPLATSRTIAKALCTANTAPIAPSRMKWRVSRSMPQAECMTPIVWPSGSVKSPMTRPSMTSSGPIMRVPPRLSACASEASTSGTST